MTQSSQYLRLAVVWDRHSVAVQTSRYYTRATAVRRTQTTVHEGSPCRNQIDRAGACARKYGTVYDAHIFVDHGIPRRAVQRVNDKEGRPAWS